MWPAILGILRTVGAATTGYWLNDVATWFANVTGIGQKVTSPNGGFKWWYVLFIALALAGSAALVIWSISLLVPIKRKKR